MEDGCKGSCIWYNLFFTNGGVMLSGGITLLSAAGTVFTAYQAYHQDVSDRQTVILCAVGGVVFSIFLQTIAGRFSDQKTSEIKRIFRVLVWDINSVLSSVILPLTVFYGYVKKRAELINRTTLGIVHIDPVITIFGRDVTHLYPALVGFNLGFSAGQVVGRFLGHFKPKEGLS
jgi:L-cystine uptake protein TcyP (sodium:dicarboxylate symporter family)